MKIYRARIKDSVAFKGNPNKSHRYVIFEEEPKIKAYQIGHLFKPDKKRFYLVDKGFVYKYKFSDEEMPVIIKKESKDSIKIKDLSDIKNINDNDIIKLIKLFK